MSATRPAVGIRRTPFGWQVYGRVHGQFFSKRFPFETALKVLKEWRHDRRTAIRAKHLGAAQDLPPSGSLARDVADYLVVVQAMPTIDQRTYDLGCWVTALGGDRPRRGLRAPELAATLSAWKTGGLTAATCNRRRTALMHLWHRLDGKGAPNPLRDVPRFQEAAALPRGRPYALIERILKAMQPSKSRARLKAMAYIGMAQCELKRIRPREDWNRTAGTLTLRGRRKGEGTPSRVLKLTARATAALREMERRQAFTPFSNSTLGKRWAAALTRVRATDPSVPHIRVIDLRHSVGTEIYRLTGDLKSVKEYLGHASLKTSERYMHAAVSVAVSRAAAAMNRAAQRRR